MKFFVENPTKSSFFPWKKILLVQQKDPFGPTKGSSNHSIFLFSRQWLKFFRIFVIFLSKIFSSNKFDEFLFFSSNKLKSFLFYHETPWPVLYTRFLQKPLVSITVVLFTLLYLIVSLYGCTRLVSNLRATKLLTDGSPIHAFFELLDKHMYNKGILAQVLVMRPPDLDNSTDISEFFNLVRDLESTKYSLGQGATILWLKEYLENAALIQDPTETQCERINAWLSYAVNKFWDHVINIDRVARFGNRFSFSTNDLDPQILFISRIPTRGTGGLGNQG